MANNNNNNNKRMNEWINTFSSMVAHKFGVDKSAVMALANETSEILEFNPLDVKTTIEVGNKRARNDEPPAPPPEPPPTSTKASTNPAPDSAPKTEEEKKEEKEKAAAFVKSQVDSGKWVAIQATVSRTGFDHSIYGKPDGSGLFEFIVPGSEETYKYNDKIKLAGYTHFSEMNRGGWHKVTLMHNGKQVKAFGKELKWEYGEGNGGRRQWGKLY